MSEKLTVLFLPESAYGPTNQCIGLGDLLLERGHRVVFASESSWKGRLSALGFDERLIDLAEPDPEPTEDAGKFWTDFITATAPEFRKSTTEQLSTFVMPTYQALIQGAMYAEPTLRTIISEVGPDVLVEDNVVLFPALVTSGAPFVRIVSCNPLEVPDEGIAPAFSGLPEAEPAQWRRFRAEFERTHEVMWEAFNAWVLAQGASPLPYLEFMPCDGAANIYVYPAEADYVRDRPLDECWHRIDSSVRRTDAAYVVPQAVADRGDGSALVYVSLGSLGGADVELMQRLVDALAASPHRFIISLGPRADEIMLADNMVGAQTLPQTTVIPQVDLVITHGGNNTVTESLHFGKPMVLLPLFWDQHDNAQRMHELGLGVRLPTYEFTPDELNSAVDGLVADSALGRRMAELGARIRARDGLTRAADIIERVGLEHRRRGSRASAAQTGSTSREPDLD